MKNNKNIAGITLIALVITIIVLLILAGISIAMLTGDNSILKRATDAKTQTGVEQEKEIIALAYNSALTKKLGNGNSSAVIDSELNDELDNSEATASGSPIIVTFIKTGNTYEIDSQGVIKPSTPKDPSATLKIAEHKNEKFDTNTELEDVFGNRIMVPAGFKIINDSPDSVTGGIVIEDVDAGSAGTAGSQFVWIATGDVYTDTNGTKVNIKLGRYEFDENGVPSNYGSLKVSTVKSFLSYMNSQEDVDEMLGSGAYEELSALSNKSDSEIQSWIDEGGNVEQSLAEMMSPPFTEETTSGGSSTQKAIAKNLSDFLTKASKGYYIGRYEARTTIERTYSSELTQITVKPNDYVYNCISQSQASQVSKNMYTSELFESDLINSYAWDTAILFLQTFDNRTSDYKSNLNYREKYSNQVRISNVTSKTGTNNFTTLSDIDKICNIYDMSANYFEWTTETFTATSQFPAVYRGEYNNNSSAIGNTTQTRSMASVSSGITVGFRTILYL